jgi:hypothetical protein
MVGRQETMKFDDNEQLVKVLVALISTSVALKTGNSCIYHVVSWRLAVSNL